MRFLIAAILLYSSAAMAQDVRPLMEVWNEGVTAYMEGDHEGFRDAMLEVETYRPSQYSIMYNVAVGHALVGDTEAALAQLEKLAGQGLYIPLAGDEDFASLEGLPLYDTLRAQISANNRALGDSALLLELEPTGTLAEGVAVNTETGDMFISNVRTGDIIKVAADGSATEFANSDSDHGMAGIFGMEVDLARNVLWVISTPAAPYRGVNQASEPRSALFALNLDTGAVEMRAPTPGVGTTFLGEVVLAPNGDVYVSDSGDPVIYRLDEEAGELRAVVRDPALANVQGFAFAPDGRMYIADYAMGLFVFDPSEGAVQPVDVPFVVNSTGVDGLFYYDGNLIGIQNGLRPFRIVRFLLSEDGRSVTDTEIIARSLELWDEPTLGQIVGDQLIYNAASGWPSFDQNGDPLGDANLPPARIMSVDLN